MTSVLLLSRLLHITSVYAPRHVTIVIPFQIFSRRSQAIDSSAILAGWSGKQDFYETGGWLGWSVYRRF